MTVTGQCRRTTQFIPTWCSLLDSLLLDATWCHLIPIAEGFPAVGALKLGIGQAENVESKNSARASGAGTGGTKQWWYIYIYVCIYVIIHIYIYMVPPQRSTLIFLWGRVAHIYIYINEFASSSFPEVHFHVPYFHGDGGREGVKRQPKPTQEPLAEGIHPLKFTQFFHVFWVGTFVQKTFSSRFVQSWDFVGCAQLAVVYWKWQMVLRL